MAFTTKLGIDLRGCRGEFVIQVLANPESTHNQMHLFVQAELYLQSYLYYL